MKKELTFTGKISGDCECFCWRDVSNDERRAVIGEDKYQYEKELLEELKAETKALLKETIKLERRLVEGEVDSDSTELRVEALCTEMDAEMEEEQQSLLYPGDIWRNLGCGDDKKYKFTIIVEGDFDESEEGD